PFEMDELTRDILILTAGLPTSSAQSMITEQYHTNTTAAGRAVFLTTLFSLVTVPLIMAFAL
ncbi:MAG: AEC family transporter, partial [Clostridiales bacterium]|nr:AEC family transporter [Clostridiales bacterium]